MRGSPNGRARPLLDLAALFEFPGPELAGRVDAALTGLPAPAASHLQRFEAFVAATPPGELEDLYNRTFDLIPRCPPYLAYQLHGDTYRRGEVMARLAGLSRECGLEIAGGELPDHVSVALRLLASARAEDSAALAGEVVLPALERMRGLLSQPPNPFAELVAAAEAATREAFPATPGKEGQE